MNKKILSLVLASTFVLGNCFGTTAFAAETTTAAQTQNAPATTASQAEGASDSQSTTLSAKEAEQKLKEQQKELKKI